MPKEDLVISFVRRYIAMALATAVVLSSIGCGGSGLDFGQVNGKLTLDGKPLGNAEVTFQPASGPLASGESDAQGNFKLMSSTGDKGALVGSHKVLVRPTLAGGAGGSASDGNTSGGDAAKIPAIYQDMSTSNLTANVSAGENTITLELKSTAGSESE
jgi:hypothetical protein